MFKGYYFENFDSPILLLPHPILLGMKKLHSSIPRGMKSARELTALIAGSLMTPCKVPIMDCHVLLKKCIQPLPYHLSNMWNQIRSFQSIFCCLGLILVKIGPVLHVWQPLLSISNGPILCPLAQNVQNSILGGICYENLADERKKCQKIHSWKFQNFQSHF